jgi:hypothetical protein
MHCAVYCGSLSSLVFMSKLLRVCLVLEIVLVLYQFHICLNFSETPFRFVIYTAQRLYLFIWTSTTLGINNSQWNLGYNFWAEDHVWGNYASYALVFMVLVCWLGLLHKIVTSLSILVSGLCMLYHNFYCIFSCYLYSKKPCLRYLYGCSYNDVGCTVIEVSSFYGTQQSRCLSYHLRMEADPVSETLCSLVFRIPDNGPSPKTQ